MYFTIGDNPDVTLNPVCASGSQVGGEITDGGTWSCQGTGLYFGYYTKVDYFNIMEIALFNLTRV